jgi:glutamate transport system permease protein
MSSSALYDVPGPKAAARHRLYGGLALLALLALLGWVVWELFDTHQFTYQKWMPFEYQGIQRLLLHGLGNTLKAFALTALFALPFGALFAAAGSPTTGWCAGPRRWWWSSSGPCRCW